MREAEENRQDYGDCDITSHRVGLHDCMTYGHVYVYVCLVHLKRGVGGMDSY